MRAQGASHGCHLEARVRTSHHLDVGADCDIDTGVAGQDARMSWPHDSMDSLPGDLLHDVIGWCQSAAKPRCKNLFLKP